MTKKNVDNSSQYLMGKHSLEEAISYSPDRIIEIISSKPVKEDPLLQKALNSGIKVSFLKKEALTNLLQSDSHQGYAARIKRHFFHDVNEFLEETETEKVLYVALDSIYDPHNFGAILRASECFGVGGIIFSKNRGCDVTATVSKTSVGASELLQFLKVSNLAETLKKLKDFGFSIITAEIAQDAVSSSEFTFPQKSILILGSEGEGVRALLSQLADYKVYIPMKGRIDSLNVSQAAAVLLSIWK